MNTSMTFPGFTSPAAGPDAPLDMLSACHTRVEKQCQTLERLQIHLTKHSSDLEAQEAAATIMRYFDTAARHHHEDEEQDLFPALLEAMAGSDPVCIRQLTTQLIAEHRQLEGVWLKMRLQLQSITKGESVLLDPTCVETFTEGYRLHIHREEHELLPMAARLLTPQSLKSLGEAMLERRKAS